MKLQKVSIGTLLSTCAGFALSTTLVSCALDSDEIGPDADTAGENDSTNDDGLGLWTDIKKPPYHAAAISLSRSVVELKPEVSAGDITLTAALRWRDHAAGAVNPQVSFGLLSSAGEQTLLQVFENDGLLRTRVDLEMTDALEVGVWYRVAVTIADAPGRPVQARIFDQEGEEVWRSCGGAASARCPSTQLDADDMENVRLSVIVDDLRAGEGQVEVKDISLKRNP